MIAVSSCILSSMGDTAGVQIVFLPVYSPELDATEFVFHEIKLEVKKHREEEKRLWIDTLVACSKISHTKMFGFYQKALYGWSKDF